jgi:hypothetical protein
MNTNATKTRLAFEPKPLRLIASEQPKTSVFEKHLAYKSDYYKSVYSPKRKLGGYNKSSSSPVSSQTTLVGRAVKHSKFKPVNQYDQSNGQEIVLTIPIHKLKSMEKGAIDYVNSFTMDDVDTALDILAYTTIGGFASFAQEILALNKQSFLIAVPFVLISSLKLALKPFGSDLTRRSIFEGPLLQCSVPVKTRLMIYRALIFSNSLLLALNFRAVAQFKAELDHNSKLDIFILMVMGALLVNLVVSLSNNFVTLSTLEEATLVSNDRPIAEELSNPGP